MAAAAWMRRPQSSFMRTYDVVQLAISPNILNAIREIDAKSL